MIEIRIPTDTEIILEDTLSVCKKMDDISTIGLTKIALKKIKTNIAQLLKKRAELLQKAGYHESDCVNLITVERLPQLQKRYVVIRIGEVIAPIRIAETTVITDNYDAVLYSINKYGKQQQLEHANKFDVELYRMIKHYKTIRAQFIADNPLLLQRYKIGDRIKINLFNGVYWIETITETHARITCRKWQTEGRKSMTVHVSDIKGYAYDL